MEKADGAPAAIRPRLSYQCAMNRRMAWRKGSGTSDAASPNPTVTSSSISAAMRVGSGPPRAWSNESPVSGTKTLRVDGVHMAVEIEDTRVRERLRGPGRT